MSEEILYRMLTVLIAIASGLVAMWILTSGEVPWWIGAPMATALTVLVWAPWKWLTTPLGAKKQKPSDTSESNSR